MLMRRITRYSLYIVRQQVVGSASGNYYVDHLFISEGRQIRLVNQTTMLFINTFIVSRRS